MGEEVLIGWKRRNKKPRSLLTAEQKRTAGLIRAGARIDELLA
jgi:hypothetical protein